MAIGIGGAGCKIASKLDPEAILVNVSEAEMTQVTSGGQRLLDPLHFEEGSRVGQHLYRLGEAAGHPVEQDFLHALQ